MSSLLQEKIYDWTNLHMAKVQTYIINFIVIKISPKYIVPHYFSIFVRAKLTINEAFSICSAGEWVLETQEQCTMGNQ